MKRFPQLSMLFLATAMAAGSSFAVETQLPASAPKVFPENSQEAKVNLVNLTTRADQVLSNDTMMVRLFSEHDSKTSQEAFDQTTKAMDRLFELQRTEAGKEKLKGIKISSVGRSTMPIYAKEAPGVIVSWRDRAEIDLESQDFKLLSSLVSEIASDIQVESITFKVSDQARKAVEEKLTTQALLQFSQKAEVTTKILKGTDYGLVNVSVGDVTPAYDGQYGIRPMMSYSMKARGGAPEAQVAAGDSKLSVSINGTIQILHR